MKDGTIQRVEWRCASRDSGGECAVIPGIPAMQWSSVDSLVLPQNVRECFNLVPRSKSHIHVHSMHLYAYQQHVMIMVAHMAVAKIFEGQLYKSRDSLYVQGARHLTAFDTAVHIALISRQPSQVALFIV